MYIKSVHFSCKLNESFLSNETYPPLMDVHRRYLLDDSLLDFFSCAASSMSSSQVEDSGHETCDERSGGGVDNRVVSPAEQTLLLTEMPSIACFEGPVRRKTVMKNGDRPKVCIDPRVRVLKNVCTCADERLVAILDCSGRHKSHLLPR